MKTKIFLSSGKFYQVDLSLDELVGNYLLDEAGVLKQTLVHFESFSINPSQIVSLEEKDESDKKPIGY